MLSYTEHLNNENNLALSFWSVAKNLRVVGCATLLLSFSIPDIKIVFVFQPVPEILRPDTSGLQDDNRRLFPGE